MKLNSIRLKNFRCFKDTGDVAIKPITILVGANSSGKSSFLKFFPLLKQSYGKRLSGVFFWNGKEVDFKDFRNTVRKGEKQIEVGFNFEGIGNVNFGIIADGDHFDQLSYFKNESFGTDFKNISLGEKTIHIHTEESDKDVSNKYIPLIPSVEYEDEDDLSAEDVDELDGYNEAIFALNENYAKLCKSIDYVKPLRSNPQRNYIINNYLVTELASDGSNLPMFLASMTPDRKIKLNDWLSTHLNFTVETELNTSIEIKIKEENYEPVNIVDLGFGFSQVLPIAVMIWESLDKNMNENYEDDERFIIIEQPELHLHPRFQARFAKMLSKVVSLGKNVKFIIETHCPTILNRIGVEIYKKTITTNDVNVVMFNRNIDGTSVLEATNYSEDGYINDWPIDFLEDDMED